MPLNKTDGEVLQGIPGRHFVLDVQGLHRFEEFRRACLCAAVKLKDSGARDFQFFVFPDPDADPRAHLRFDARKLFGRDEVIAQWYPETRHPDKGHKCELLVFVFAKKTRGGILNKIEPSIDRYYVYHCETRNGQAFLTQHAAGAA